MSEHEDAMAVIIEDLKRRLADAEQLSWKNWRDREEAYAEMRIVREERDRAVALLRKEMAHKSNR